MKVTYQDSFLRDFSKIKDIGLKRAVAKQLRKIINNPKIGKPLKYSRKLTRELYIPPFRLYYWYNEYLDSLTIIELSYKRDQW